MTRYLLLITMMTCNWPINLTAQDTRQVTLYDFRLYKGDVDKEDVTEWLLNTEMHTVFYIVEDDSTLMLANISYNSDSQSFGELILTMEPIDQVSAEGDPVEVRFFNWFYRNSYDDEFGVAKIKAVFTFKKDATYLTIYILPNDFRMIIYHGVTDGDPDF